MGTRELLRYLEKLEIGLSSFSYEELGTVEAGQLKKSFEVFKSGLEDKVFGISAADQLEVIYEQVGIQGPIEKEQSDANKNSKISEDHLQLLSLIDSLQQTPLSSRQKEITQQLRKIAQGQAKTPQSLVIPNVPSRAKKWESDFSSDKINLKMVLEECMGRMELLEELIRIYKQNILEFIGSLKIYLQSQNFKEIRVACQKVQPSLRMMRTVGLLEIIQLMDMACKTDNDIKYLTFLYDQFLTEYPKVEAVVDFEIDALRNM